MLEKTTHMSWHNFRGCSRGEFHMFRTVVRGIQILVHLHAAVKQPISEFVFLSRRRRLLQYQ